MKMAFKHGNRLTYLKLKEMQNKTIWRNYLPATRWAKKPSLMMHSGREAVASEALPHTAAGVAKGYHVDNRELTIPRKIAVATTLDLALPCL